MHNYIALAIPFFFAPIALELVVAREAASGVSADGWGDRSVVRHHAAGDAALRARHANCERKKSQDVTIFKRVRASSPFPLPSTSGVLTYRRAGSGALAGAHVAKSSGSGPGRVG